jgi:hypothetical protein
MVRCTCVREVLRSIIVGYKKKYSWEEFLFWQHTHGLVRLSCPRRTCRPSNITSCDWHEGRISRSLGWPTWRERLRYLYLLVPTRILFEGKVAYEGGRSEMEWRTGGERWRLSREFSSKPLWFGRTPLNRHTRCLRQNFTPLPLSTHEQRPFPVHPAPRRDMLIMSTHP